MDKAALLLNILTRKFGMVATVEGGPHATLADAYADVVHVAPGPLPSLASVQAFESAVAADLGREDKERSAIRSMIDNEGEGSAVEAPLVRAILKLCDGVQAAAQNTGWNNAAYDGVRAIRTWVANKRA